MARTIVVLAVIAAAISLLVIVAWLKGTLSLANPRSRDLLFLAGVPEWWYIFGPFGAPLLLLAAAMMIGHPGSVWARTFYGERKMHKARQVHDADVATPSNA